MELCTKDCLFPTKLNTSVPFRNSLLRRADVTVHYLPFLHTFHFTTSPSTNLSLSLSLSQC